MNWIRVGVRINLQKMCTTDSVLQATGNQRSLLLKWFSINFFKLHLSANLAKALNKMFKETEVRDFKTAMVVSIMRTDSSSIRKTRKLILIIPLSFWSFLYHSSAKSKTINYVSRQCCKQGGWFSIEKGGMEWNVTRANAIIERKNISSSHYIFKLYWFATQVATFRTFCYVLFCP